MLFIVGGLEYNGALREAIALADHLRRRHGASVELWGLRPPGPPPHPWMEPGFPCRYVRLRWTRKPLRRLRRLLELAWRLRRARPDVVLAYNIVPLIMCGLTWRFSGARSYLWFQIDEIVSLADAPWEERAARRTPHFVSNSQHAADSLCRELQVPADRIEVVRAGVTLAEPEATREEWRRCLGVDDDCFVACMVANVQPRKDQATLVRAWPIVSERLRSEGRRGLLVFAGRVDDESAVRLARESGVDDVRFLGFVSDVAGLLAAADLGVFSSHLEGCPAGIVECMHSGLAVVASDIPGNREALGPEGEGWIVPGGDERAFAERILVLARDPGLRAKVGEANRRHVASEFSLEAMGERLSRLLATELARRA